MRKHHDQPDFTDAIRSLSDETLAEAQRMGDYFYKAPMFLKEQERIEIEKLDRYFPDNRALQELRWNHEITKKLSQNLQSMLTPIPEQ